jgi:hypothetical protein
LNRLFNQHCKCWTPPFALMANDAGKPCFLPAVKTFGALTSAQVAKVDFPMNVAAKGAFANQPALTSPPAFQGGAVFFKDQPVAIHFAWQSNNPWSPHGSSRAVLADD